MLTSVVNKTIDATDNAYIIRIVGSICLITICLVKKEKKNLMLTSLMHLTVSESYAEWISFA